MMTDGSFNFPFDPIAGIQDWTLEASTANLNMHFAGGAKAEPRALVRLEPDSAKDGVLHVDLHLGAAGLIAGKVSGVEGQGRCIVTAIPSGARSFVPSHADSSEFSCSPDEKGSFVLRELRGESYDLVLTQASDAQFRSALLENIPVGTENVDLRLTRPLDVVLHVSATPAHGGEPIARMLVLFDWPTMPPRTSDTPGDSSDEWPEAIPISDFRQPLERGWNGGRQTIGGVHHSFSLKPWPSDQFDPPPQEAGWIRVGVIAWDALGRQCLPVTTGMQRWEPGEHEVRLAVQRSCDLRVRLSIPPASTGKLELVAPGGGSIRFSLNGARLRRSASVHGGQQLELSCVPAGQCTLRFTPAQAGPTKEMQVTVDDSGKLVVFE
jgi:hypothetical protein